MGARITAAGMIVVLATAAEAQQQSAPCPAGQPRENRAALWGVVRDSATALPLQRLDVVVSWPSGGGGRRRETRVETDAQGVYRACDIPPGERVRVEAQARGRTSDIVNVAAGQTSQLDLVLVAASSTVVGRVVEASGSRGIGDAEVRVRGSSVRAVSGNDGSFELPMIPGGTWALEISHLGYRTRQDTLRVEHGTRVQLTIALATEAIPLPAIEVAVRSYNLEQVGFYERRERGFGTFLTRQQWENMQPQYPSDIMRTVAGVRVVQRSRQGAAIGNIVVDRSNCAFRYFMDGARVGPDFQLDDIPTDWIEALEVYKGVSEVPARFTINSAQPRANCGVIVIWTKTAR